MRIVCRSRLRIRSNTNEQYASALQQEGVLKDKSVELLYILYDAPNCEATAKQIAQIFGYSDFPPVIAFIVQDSL